MTYLDPSNVRTSCVGAALVIMVALAMSVRPVGAQLTGTFVDALPVDEGGNTVQTDTGDEGGFYTGPQATWADPVPGPQAGLWHINAGDGGLDEDGNPGRGTIENVAWYDHSDFAPGITTTISELTPSASYEIRVVFPAVTHTTNLIGIDAAFEGEDFSTFHQDNSRDTGLTAGGLIIFEGLLGTTQANADGEIHVDIAVASGLDPLTDSPFARNMYDGLSYLLLGDSCDFDGSGSLDIGDIDMLSTAIIANSNESPWDINNDGEVDADDLNFFVVDEGKLNSFIGDVNVDGEFDSGDLVVMFQGGKFESGESANWATGDLNADGEFNTSDLVAAFQDGGFETGPKAGVSVPEPTMFGLVLFGFWGAMGFARQLGQGP